MHWGSVTDGKAILVLLLLLKVRPLKNIQSFRDYTPYSNCYLLFITAIFHAVSSETMLKVFLFVNRNLIVLETD